MNPRIRTVICLPIILAAAWCVGASFGAVDEGLARFAPAETLLYLEVSDMTRLRETWAKTPYARMWEDPSFSGFFKPLKKDASDPTEAVAKQTGASPEELKRIFPGRAAIFRSDFICRLGDTPSAGYLEVDNGFLAEFKGAPERVRALVEKFIGETPKDAERRSEEFKGVRIYTSIFWQPVGDMPVAPAPPPTPPADPHAGMTQYHYEYAFVDNLCIVLEGQRAYMKKVLQNYFTVKEGRKPEGSLAASPNFQLATRPFPPKPDLLGYVNIERYLVQAADYPALAPFKRPAWRLEELRSAAFSGRLAPQGIELDATFCTTPTPKGIARLFVHEGSNAFRATSMVPGGAVFYLNSLLDLKDLQRLLNESSPSDPQSPVPSGFADSLKEISGRAGVDIEKEILANLGSEIGVFSRSRRAGAPADGPRAESPVVFVQLTREAAVAENLAKTVETLGKSGPRRPKCEPADFHGFRIYSLREDPGDAPSGLRPERGESRFHFAAANSFLVLSADLDVLKEVLDNVKGTGGASLTRNDAFRLAVKQIPANYTGLLWYDAQKVMVESLKAAEQGLSIFGLLDLGVDWDARPSAESFARYLGRFVAGSYVSRDTLHLHAVAINPEEFKKN